MNEQELGKEIARFLDSGAEETIKQSTLYRLQSARRTALENCQPTLRIINSGDGTSVYGGHDEHFNTGKLLLLLVALCTFAMVSVTYWQFLGKGKSSLDTTVLVDDLSTDVHMENESELDDDISIDAYIDNVLKLVDDLSVDAHSDNNEPELIDEVPTDTRIEDEPELTDELPEDTHVDNNELDEWLDSNK
ncbi:MAG: DUF3619 family protein [Nitrosomonas sp.]|uniref:DUF3619 family protein n=1 Tax=Nitrosomonas sp. TaxID=42353 RepID=UPI00273306C0|nr:DUF3619 family protein [Nitrosomonas sp.]MDP3282733.1 DUF3619 family protein [Nitrosomonas sp.]